MNWLELQIMEKLENAGWEVVRGGAPDFLLVKRNNKNKIVKVMFAEVKNKTKLEPHQKIYHQALKFLKARVMIVRKNFLQNNPRRPEKYVSAICRRLALSPAVEAEAKRMLKHAPEKSTAKRAAVCAAAAVYIAAKGAVGKEDLAAAAGISRQTLIRALATS